MTAPQRQAFPAHVSVRQTALAGGNNQETWVMRADFTTGDRR